MSSPNDTTSHYTPTKTEEQYELVFILNDDQNTSIVLNSKKEAIDMADKIYYAITRESKIKVDLVEMHREFVMLGDTVDNIGKEIYGIPIYFVNLVLSKYNMMIKRIMRSIL